jgi:hypothetical protein
MTSKPTPNDVAITSETIMLRFGDMEPVVIPRATLRTRLQLIDWVYRLTGWPGMNRCRLRTFIAAIFAHHGWALPESKENAPATNATTCNAAGELQLQTVADL